jgi:hypothetical protein
VTGERPHLRIGHAPQLLQQRRGCRVTEVGRAEQQVVAVVVPTPEPRAAGLQRAERGVDHQVREPVDFRVEQLPTDPLRVLIVAMPDLAGLDAGQPRHPHAVVVDEPQHGSAARPGDDQDVAVLEVAVCDPGASESGGEFDPLARQLAQRRGMTEAVANGPGE